MARLLGELATLVGRVTFCSCEGFFPSARGGLTLTANGSDNDRKVPEGAWRMAHTLNKTIAGLAVVAATLSVDAWAQVTEKKATVPGGTPRVSTVQLKGEVVYLQGDSLVVKMSPSGEYRLFVLQPGKTATVDGKVMPLNKVRIGTALTANVTITEKPLVDRTIMSLNGTVWWASASSVILTLANGENRQYDVPPGLKFSADGQARDVVDLKPGMKVSATKVVESPRTEVTTANVVTGVSPK